MWVIVLGEPPGGIPVRDQLAPLGHRVIDATDGDLSAIEPPPDVAVVYAAHADAIAALRATARRRVYVIAALPALDATAVQACWHAGADDLMRADATREELAGRVAALERIRRWVAAMGNHFVHDEPSTSESLGAVEDILAQELGDMLGGGLQPVPMAEMPQVDQAAQIPLTVADDGEEMTIGIGVVGGDADALGARLFGEPVAGEIMADALRELANTGGGALKRTAISQGRTASLGLPTDATDIRPEPDARGWQLVAEDGLRLHVWVAGHASRLRRLPIGSLQEGMVLAQPVRDGAGAMLVPAGTVLTWTTVEQLHAWMGPAALVEVARAA